MFAKIFNQIYDSSIVESPETRFTFMDLLILADKNGVVDMTLEAIARRTNRPLEIINKTIIELEGPDPHSRTPDANGARIFRLDEHRDWGWGIVNYDYYRKLASQDQRREKTKIRTQKWRKKLKESSPERHIASQGVTGDDSPSPSASAFASASAWEELKRNPLYEGVDFEREVEKAKQWCRRKGRRLTKRFFENWLEKADRVLFTPTPKPKWLPPAREVTEEELEAQRKIVRESSEKLRQELNR